MASFFKKILTFLLLSTMVTANAGDLSHWMKEKANTLRGFKDLLLTEIAMPGTHDALTYKLEKEKRGSGAAGIALKIPLLGSGITKLSKAQGDDMIGQFSNGSRYFDLRIEKTGKGFEGVHGIYNGPIEKSLRDFKKFLVKHPGEIVLIDIQKIEPTQLNELMGLMKNIFGSMIYPRTKGRVNLSYESFISSGKRVIFFAKNANTKDGTNLAFDREKFLKSQWHNQQDAKKLMAKIIEFETKNPRSLKTINVIQAQTTPNAASGALSIAKSIFTLGKKGGLKKNAEKDREYQKKLLDRAKNDKKGGNLLKAMNVFMTDHLTEQQGKDIINLNDLKVKRAVPNT